MIWIEKNLAFEFEVWYNLTGLTEVRTNTYAVLQERKHMDDINQMEVGK